MGVKINFDPEKLGPKCSVKIGLDITDMDKCHQDKCPMDKCHPDVWHIVKMAPETYL